MLSKNVYLNSIVDQFVRVSSGGTGAALPKMGGSGNATLVT